MGNKDILEFIATKVVLLDGASGTQMQKLGMPAGVCPETFAISNPDLLTGFQREYYESGSDIVYTFTFGANSNKLKHYGINEEKVIEINEKIAKISCDLRDEMKSKYPGRSFYVAGDLAPTGEFLEPFGELAFHELTAIYKKQAHGLLNAGVDLFVVETMMDLNQTRAAVIAVKEICDLPVFTTLTFDNGKTLSGESPSECLITLESLGVRAFGANCSTGPLEMAKLLSGIREISSIPIIAKPNAGMPVQINGETVFPMGAEEFSLCVNSFLDEGITILGGCCGTTPEHILKLSSKVLDKPKILIQNKNSGRIKSSDMICSSQKRIEISKIDVSSKNHTIVCTYPLELADDVSDLISEMNDDSGDYVIIDFTAYELSENFLIDDLRDGIINLGMYTKTPIVILSSNYLTIKTIGENYCGRAGILCCCDFDEKTTRMIDFYGMARIKTT